MVNEGKSLAALWQLSRGSIDKYVRDYPREAARSAYDCVRELSATDFWFHLEFVLGIPVMEKQLHQPIADWMQDWRRMKKLLLIPRIHLKTTLFNCGFVHWLMCHNHNIRVLEDSHKIDDSVAMLELIKGMMGLPNSRKYFPDLRPAKSELRGDKWGGAAILVQREMNLKENTIECCSTDAEVVSRHYDLIIHDDVVTPKSVLNATLIEKTANHVRHCQSLLDPGGRELFIGTRYDYSDEYGSIIETPDRNKDFDILVMRATVDGLPTGRPIYGRRFTAWKEDVVSKDGDPTKNKLSLPKLRRQQGPYVYSCQYNNDPIASENQVFRREWVKYVDVLPAAARLRWFQVGDLSSEKETKTSYNVLVTGAVDDKCNTYITDIYWGNCTIVEYCKMLFRSQLSDQKPCRVGVGTSAYERTLKSYLRHEMARRKVWIPLFMLPQKEAEKPKDDRIRGLQPWFESGCIHFLKTCRNIDKAEDELMRFPRYTLKDILDSMAIIEHIMYPGRKPPGPIEKNPKSDADILDLLFESPSDRLGADRVMKQGTTFRFGRR